MNEPPVCEKCGDEYWLGEGCEVSKYCDPCAQERVAEVEAENVPILENNYGSHTAAELLVYTGMMERCSASTSSEILRK